MNAESCVTQLRASREFFDRSTSTLTEDDARFAPKEGMLTVAQHLVHVAQGIAWFVEGAFAPEGFDTDFATRFAPAPVETTLASAREQLGRAFDQAFETFGSKTPDELAVALPPGEVMGGQPRWHVVSGIEEHTAHHRGALAVYARLCGHQPPVPYGP